MVPDPGADDGARGLHKAAVHDVVGVGVDVGEVRDGGSVPDLDATAVIQEDVAMDHHVVTHLQVVPEAELHVVERLEVLSTPLEDPLGQDAPERAESGYRVNGKVLEGGKIDVTVSP